MSAVGEALEALRLAFSTLQLDWYVFGAQAVVVRGAARATQDIDVTVRVPRATIAAMIDELQRVGVRHRYPDIAEELLASGSVLPMVHSGGMEIDVVVAGAGLEELAMSRATDVVVDGVEVPVAHATDLVVMKILAGRGKDIDDARGLLAAGEVDEEEVRDLLMQLEAALGQSDLLPAFDRIARERDR